MATTIATMATVDTRPICPADPAAKLRGERNGSRSGERGGESGEHDEVGVKRDPLQAANAKRGEAVLVLQPPELSLPAERPR